MDEVAQGIFRITEKGAFGAIKPPVNIYIIAGPDGLIFDAGYGTAGDVRYFVSEFCRLKQDMRSRGIEFNVRRILPSHAHPDHFSGLAKLRKELGLSIVLTRSMAHIISSRQAYRSSYNVSGSVPVEVKNAYLKKIKAQTFGRMMSFIYEKVFGTKFIPDPDVLIDDNTSIDINGEKWQIIHSPGHSTDHISLYNKNTGILFAGDNILRSITTWLGPPKSDLMSYIRSLENLLDLPKLTLILSAHGSTITNPKDRIQELIQWRNERTSHVMALIRASGNSGITLRKMLDSLYEKESWLKHRMAEGWVIVTLEYLERQGIIRHRIVGKQIFFTCVDAV